MFFRSTNLPLILTLLFSLLLLVAAVAVVVRAVIVVILLLFSSSSFFLSMISIAILLPAWNRLHFYYCNKIAPINSQISDRNGWKRLKYQNAIALNEPGKRLRSALYRSLQHPLIFLLLNLSLRWHILCVILFMVQIAAFLISCISSSICSYSHYIPYSMQTFIFHPFHSLSLAFFLPFLLSRVFLNMADYMEQNPLSAFPTPVHLFYSK